MESLSIIQQQVEQQLNTLQCTTQHNKNNHQPRVHNFINNNSNNSNDNSNNNNNNNNILTTTAATNNYNNNNNKLTTVTNYNLQQQQQQQQQQELPEQLLPTRATVALTDWLTVFHVVVIVIYGLAPVYKQPIESWGVSLCAPIYF